MGGLRAASKLDELGDSVRQVIKAYHGSPYDFDRFDASKIGTGEGAQAYGHGLYFAGAEDVAKKYRDNLSDAPDIWVAGELLPSDLPPFWRKNSPRENAIRLLQKQAKIRPDDPIQALREAILDADDSYGGPVSRQVVDSLMRFKSEGLTFGPRKGKTYEVEITHPESALLDYDATLIDQPSGVRAAIERLGLPSVDSVGSPKPGAPGVRHRFSGNDLRAAYGFDSPWDIRGKHIYDAVASLPSVSAGRPYSERMAWAAEALREAGVPGVRYLDEYSRGAGQGTRNYVAFPGTEDSIRILRKYGLMAPIAAGAAAGSEGTVNR
jgi:hypothetical protein